MLNTTINNNSFALKADKQYGMIFYSALGDSLGLGCEFMTAEMIKKYYKNKPFIHSEIIDDDHRSTWKKGEYTDDTEQMLILYSILGDFHDGKKGYEDLKTVSSKKLKLEFAKRLTNWRKNGGRGIGDGVRWVMEDKHFLTNPTLSAKNIWRRSLKSSAEDGAIMRTSICATVKDITTSLKCARAFAFTTHYDPRVIACTISLTYILHKILHTDIKFCEYNNFIYGLIEEAKQIGIKEIENHPYNKHACQRGYKNAINRYKRRFLSYFEEIDEIANLKLYKGDYRCHTRQPFKCALYALRKCAKLDLSKATTFEQIHSILFEIILSGGDADTNACVAASCMGALFGFSNIPTFWKTSLLNVDDILKVSRNSLLLSLDKSFFIIDNIKFYAEYDNSIYEYKNKEEKHIHKTFYFPYQNNSSIHFNFNINVTRPQQMTDEAEDYFLGKKFLIPMIYHPFLSNNCLLNFQDNFDSRIKFQFSETGTHLFSIQLFL
jgi:ADP-ribosylglycohydrolase